VFSLTGHIKLRIKLMTTYWGKVSMDLIENGVELKAVPIIYGTRDNKSNWKLIKFSLESE
jgi:hypothetical protein